MRSRARSGSGRSMPAGHSRPNGQLLESLCTKPVVDSVGDVAGRASVEPRARSPRAVRERRGRDLPRPRVALGHGQDFAYPIDPSHHVHRDRDYQLVGLKVHILVLHIATLPLHKVYSSIRLIYQDYSLPWGWGPIRSGKEGGRESPVRSRSPRYPPASAAGLPLDAHAPATLAVEPPAAGLAQLERLARGPPSTSARPGLTQAAQAVRMPVPNPAPPSPPRGRSDSRSFRVLVGVTTGVPAQHRAPFSRWPEDFRMAVFPALGAIEFGAGRASPPPGILQKVAIS